MGLKPSVHASDQERPRILVGVPAGRLGAKLRWVQDGIQIVEVMPQGALALAEPRVSAGDVIVAVDGEEGSKRLLDAWIDQAVEANAGMRLTVLSSADSSDDRAAILGARTEE
mmetsp:Transcript_29103/g.70566  ORF Transcript_29103/g.70566 Transcript_29103/m.70566 type:complete len:113 (-) Transcript_29103:11-349(-)